MKAFRNQGRTCVHMQPLVGNIFGYIIMTRKCDDYFQRVDDFNAPLTLAVFQLAEHCGQVPLMLFEKTLIYTLLGVDA